MFEEFKKFAFKGNVIDMAVGVIIGGAFGKIVTSIVNDMLMPLIGVLLGNVNFSSLKLVLSEAEVNAAGEVIRAESALMYGAFIQSVVDFLIIAMCIFMLVKVLNGKKKKEPEAPPPAPPAPTTEELLGEIRDLLKERS